jgi:hypothetical protein
MATTDWLKDPDAVLDWVWDWSEWLANGETITNSVFEASVGIEIQSTSNTATSATVWLAGGSPGQPYRVSNRITTTAGRIDERTITVRVIER